jgi:hypothetical protein
MSEIKLVDMEDDKWRDAGLEKGEHWRTMKVYKCHICGCLTNHFWMFSPSWRAPRVFCPGRTSKQNLHDLLQEKVDNLSERKHPRSYLEDLKNEIEEIRKQFRDIPSDVEMIGDDWKNQQCFSYWP